MKIAVCYIAVANGPITDDYASRFVTTFHEYPPGTECDVIVVCNGGIVSTSTAVLFSSIDARLFARSNEDWDIGGYVDAARRAVSDYDMMLCCGESVYFHREGWLSRIEEAWMKYGEGMYGPFASNLVRAHLNTTAFATSPRLLRDSPLSTEDRYEWEHGKNAFWRWVASRRKPVRLVTWNGEWEPRSWRSPQDILWRGSQANCLMWCNHTERYASAPMKLKLRWSNGADQPFK